MRVLIAPDKFKGSLSALQAAQAIERGLRTVLPDVETDLAPIADGGEGFAEALGAALGAEWVAVSSLDAIGRPVEARYAWVPASRLAILEMSEASGLWRLKPEERDPMKANTYGTGLLLRDAMERGAQKILVGLGGSATTDGGSGLARALGWRFLNDAEADFEPVPATLDLVDRVIPPEGVHFPEIIAACDVQNPLLGERGTARVYSPQKGADVPTVELLEAMMQHLANVCEASLGRDFRELPGAGAAGGLGFGLLTFAGARIEPGFDIVARTMRLRERIEAADWVITGEGRMDEQTLEGKGPAGVAQEARRAGKKTLALGGAVTAIAEQAGVFDALLPIVDRPLPLHEAMAEAAPLLERAAARAARLLRW